MSTTSAAHNSPSSRSLSSDASPPGGYGPSQDAFHSILFPDPGSGRQPAEQPDHFGDLHIDQIVAAAIADREEYALAVFFATPLHDVSAVGYRHEVLSDLGRTEVRDAVDAFAVAMRAMRAQLTLSAELHHGLQTQRCFLEAASVYCEATKRFAAALAQAPVASRGFAALKNRVSAYVTSTEFTTLDDETRGLRDELAQVNYTIHVKGGHVTVARYETEDDLAADVQDTFARFKQGAVEDRRFRIFTRRDIDHVEAQILERVAKLYPDTFSSLSEFCAHHDNGFDETIVRFDREVQFYLAYLDHIAPLQECGLSFCLPEVVIDGREVHAREAFDLSLASKLAAADMTVVTNDFALEDPERVLVVTGPNQGGKTTFARMFGQLHYLASLGLPVPAAQARLLLPDRVFTHFEREESLETLRGKFEDELVRIHEILDRATARSVLVMNESFGSTTLQDALVVGGRIVRQIIDLDALCVFVTFVDELADVGPQTVSMMSAVDPGDPTQRTYKIARKPADGLAYAAALAGKYGLAYETLRERISR